MSILAHVGQPIHNLADGLLHPLTGLDHLLAMAAVGVLAALSSSRRIAWLTPIAFVGGMIAGGVAGMAGMSAPSIDAVIAVTVIALGALVAFGTKGDARWLPFLALAFGAVHGIAHGAEAPLAGNVVVYVAGFVLTTTALHAAGAISGVAIRRATLVRVTTGAAIASTGLLLLVAA